MSFTMVGFAQKNEIKAAEKALKGGDAAGAQSALEAAAGTIDAADVKVQAQYHFLRGRIYSDLAKKGTNNAFTEAIASFKKADEIETASGKAKYGKDIKLGLANLAGELVNSAVEDNGKKNYKEAGEKLYLSYQLSPKDTIYLYYAAQ